MNSSWKATRWRMLVKVRQTYSKAVGYATRIFESFSTASTCRRRGTLKLRPSNLYAKIILSFPLTGVNCHPCEEEKQRRCEINPSRPVNDRSVVHVFRQIRTIGSANVVGGTIAIHTRDKPSRTFASPTTLP